METYECIVGVPGVNNMGIVDQKVYRSAAPSEMGYHAIRSMGIKTVVNLQEESAKDLVESAGLKELHFPLFVLKEIPVQHILAITTALASPANTPVLSTACRGTTGPALSAWPTGCSTASGRKSTPGRRPPGTAI